MVFPISRWTRNVNARGPNKSIININSWCFSFSSFIYLNPEPYSQIPGSQTILGGRNGVAGVQARACTLWCSVHPVPLLIILSLGVVEEWRWEEGRVETGRPSQHPLWTENRWDLTPSPHTNARATWGCSRDCLELVFTPTTAESGSEGDSWELRAKTAKVDVVQGGLIKGVYKPVCWGWTHPVIDFNRWQRMTSIWSYTPVSPDPHHWSTLELLWFPPISYKTCRPSPWCSNSGPSTHLSEDRDTWVM